MSSLKPPADIAAKTRIITHMNTDHQDSLIRYLQNHAHLSRFSARNAHLIDITYTTMLIRSSRSTPPHVIPIDPPLSSWSDARPRVVEMDAEARKALGQSDITIREYKSPRGFMWVVMIAVTLTTILFARRAHFERGSWVGDALAGLAPGFAEWAKGIRPWVWWPMVFVHAGEVWWMEKTRCKRYSVRVGSRVWWMWVVGTFFEGLANFIRFDEVVREEVERRDKMKH